MASQLLLGRGGGRRRSSQPAGGLQLDLGRHAIHASIRYTLVLYMENHSDREFSRREVPRIDLLSFPQRCRERQALHVRPWADAEARRQRCLCGCSGAAVRAGVRSPRSRRQQRASDAGPGMYCPLMAPPVEGLRYCTDSTTTDTDHLLAIHPQGGEGSSLGSGPGLLPPVWLQASSCWGLTRGLVGASMACSLCFNS